MKPIYHFTSSAIFGVLFFLFSGNFGAGIIAFLAGVFIDLDHLIDFWALKPKNPFSIRDFLNSEKYDFQRKWVFIFFHNWELIFVLWLVCYLTGWPIYLFALASGLTLHLFLDIYNFTSGKIPFLLYFFVYRAAKGFRKV